MDQDECPNCGYNPQETLMAVGGLFILVGVPVGLFFDPLWTWTIGVIGIIAVGISQFAHPTQ